MVMQSDVQRVTAFPDIAKLTVPPPFGAHRPPPPTQSRSPGCQSETLAISGSYGARTCVGNSSLLEDVWESPTIRRLSATHRL